MSCTFAVEHVLYSSAVKRAWLVGRRPRRQEGTYTSQLRRVFELTRCNASQLSSSVYSWSTAALLLLMGRFFPMIFFV